MVRTRGQTRSEQAAADADAASIPTAAAPAASTTAASTTAASTTAAAASKPAAGRRKAAASASTGAVKPAPKRKRAAAAKTESSSASAPPAPAPASASASASAGPSSSAVSVAPAASSSVAADADADADAAQPHQKRDKGKGAAPAPAPVPAAAPAEKRQAVFRPHASQNVRDRIARAITQRMFLISRETVSPHHANFNVLGSTGNVYSVRIAHTVDCNCPDSNKGNLCKHVLFVMLKVLRCPRDDVRVFQRALLSSELEDLFANAPQAPTDMANAAVQMLFKTAHGEAVEDDTSAVAQQDDGYVKQRPISADAPDDCAICYESMTAADQAAGKLDWCRAQCGNSYHKECIDNWIEHARRTRSDVTCAFCRSKWISRDAPKGGAAGGAASAEGYINLASVQGLSTRRDTSTYNHGYNGYKRRRWW